MASKTTVQEWKHAASSMLELRTDKIEGMEVELLSSLKFSYDSLPNDTIKECFLYCCLYPEDDEIDKKELVDYWVGEGFFDDEYGDEIDKARGEGHSIIERLMAAHLLERGDYGGSHVRMHDVIRDMALWISKDKFLVRAGLGLTEAPKPRKWSGNKRISLMKNNILNLPNLISDCPNLSTLFLQRNSNLSGKVSSGFFQSMTNLRVLDLSRTGIKSLPIELGWLTRLRYLDLRGTTQLESIPKEAISTLGELQLLNLSHLKYSIGDGSTNVENSLCDPEVSIQDLDALKSLQEVHLDLKSVDVYRQFLSLTKLPRITGTLSLCDLKVSGTLHLSSTSLKMDHLISLEIKYCKGFEEIIFSGRENDPLLPNLSELHLRNLHDLRMIKVGAHVALQNLRQLVIYECYVLKHLSCIRHLRCLEYVKKIIFVVVSKEPDAQKIQKEIGEKLGDTKFVLLLDDVWDGIKLKNILTQIGVPFPDEENKCKFILTSRSAGTCNKMGAGDHKVKVGFLKSEEAWTLFKKNVGEMIINSDPEIQVHAGTMVKKCGGLPLALMVIGSAMASKTTVQEWKHAASSMLQLRTDKIEGMEVELLSSLKFSYDSLPDDTVRAFRDLVMQSIKGKTNKSKSKTQNLRGSAKFAYVHGAHQRSIHYF